MRKQNAELIETPFRAFGCEWLQGILRFAQNDMAFLCL
jgi:hypothetical protein